MNICKNVYSSKIVHIKLHTYPKKDLGSADTAAILTRRKMVHMVMKVEIVALFPIYIFHSGCLSSSWFAEGSSTPIGLSHVWLIVELALLYLPNDLFLCTCVLIFHGHCVESAIHWTHNADDLFALLKLRMSYWIEIMNETFTTFINF